MASNTSLLVTKKSNKHSKYPVHKATPVCMLMKNPTNKTTTKTHYTAYTAIGYWPFTRPKLSIEKALHAAENQVSMEILAQAGQRFPTGSKFGSWLRINHMDIVKMSHQYIGEVRQVDVPVNQGPREFRKRYCRVTFQNE